MAAGTPGSEEEQVGSTSSAVIPLPATPTNLTPSGTGSSVQAFSWTGDPNATSYQLYVPGQINQTWTTSALGCASGGTCTTPAIPLHPTPGVVQWWVYGINGAGQGGGGWAFLNVPGTPPPNPPTSLSPNGAASTSQVFGWASDGATSYQLYIPGVTNTTYTAAALGCGSGGTCTTAAIALPTGFSGSWQVAGTNATGQGTYAYASITVPGTPVPPAPYNLSPSGTATTSQLFSWTGDSTSTSYQLYIAGVINTTYTATALGCAGGGTCTTTAITLPAGTNNTWQVAGINATGEGRWATAAANVSGTPVPPAATNLAPTGPATTSQVFNWTGDAGATSYQLYIAGVINTTYTTAALGCSSGGTCTTTAVTLPPGTSLTWKVAGINATGEGAWASALITVPGTPVPPAPTNLAPTGSATTSQVFTWTGDAGATSYQLYIAGVINATYTTATLGCSSGGTCTTTAITLPAASSLNWMVRGVNATGNGAWGSAAITTP
jgi:hypothetical protein